MTEDAERTRLQTAIVDNQTAAAAAAAELLAYRATHLTHADLDDPESHPYQPCPGGWECRVCDRGVDGSAHVGLPTIETRDNPRYDEFYAEHYPTDYTPAVLPHAAPADLDAPPTDPFERARAEQLAANDAATCAMTVADGIAHLEAALAERETNRFVAVPDDYRGRTQAYRDTIALLKQRQLHAARR